MGIADSDYSRTKSLSLRLRDEKGERAEKKSESNVRTPEIVFAPKLCNYSAQNSARDHVLRWELWWESHRETTASENGIFWEASFLEAFCFEASRNLQPFQTLENLKCLEFTAIWNLSKLLPFCLNNCSSPKSHLQANWLAALSRSSRIHISPAAMN